MFVDKRDERDWYTKHRSADVDEPGKSSWLSRCHVGIQNAKRPQRDETTRFILRVFIAFHPHLRFSMRSQLRRDSERETALQTTSFVADFQKYVILYIYLLTAEKNKYFFKIRTVSTPFSVCSPVCLEKAQFELQNPQYKYQLNLRHSLYSKNLPSYFFVVEPSQIFSRINNLTIQTRKTVLAKQVSNATKRGTNTYSTLSITLINESHLRLHS